MDLNREGRQLSRSRIPITLTLIVTLLGVAPLWLPASTSADAMTTPCTTSDITTDPSFLGDWDGDGIDTPGIRRGRSFLLSDFLGTSEWAHDIPFGTPSDTPLVGDWNGDGIDTPGVKRGNVYFLLYDSTSASPIAFSWGRATDNVVVGDWDGDGHDTIGLHRLPNSFFLSAGDHLANVTNNLPTSSYATFTFGTASDIPLAGHWLTSGKDTIALRRPAENSWIIRKDDGTGTSPHVWGDPCGAPIAGSVSATQPLSSFGLRLGTSWSMEGEVSFRYPKPTVWTSSEELARARAQVSEGVQPFARSYACLKETFVPGSAAGYTCVRSAVSPPIPDLATYVPASPYQGPEYERYKNLARREAGYARDLALVSRIDSDSATRELAGEKLVDLMLAWADDPEMSDRIATTDPTRPAAEAELLKRRAGMIISRAAVNFANAYAVAFGSFLPEQRVRVEAWLRELSRQIAVSHERWTVQTFDNQTIAHTMGRLAIGLALDDRAMIDEALVNNRDRMRVLFEGALLRANAPASELHDKDFTYYQGGGKPATRKGELYDRYRSWYGNEGHGLYYAVHSLRELTLLAEMATKSRYDPGIFEITTSKGVSLKDAFLFYAPFYSSDLIEDPSYTGYYSMDKPESRQLSDGALWEIAARQYGGSSLAAVIARQDGSLPTGARFDFETFGFAAPLLFREQ
ncbi:hypothetical protein FE697_013150 [Mumia zhuanghuii]|uniref:Alginate lyase family protein n=2 Tax=Mumia TaxID=1546255 RepID=A0ABW1QQN2_9ACTN|nr:MULTISPECIES: alginate lyase family protein [Mumia]KAA1422129.1 hypothetical protein FE697_013150 [Mumia zhuanghuii]